MNNTIDFKTAKTIDSMSMMGTVPLAFANPLPSLHPLDLLVGLCCGAGLRLAVYLRGKNAKKYRHGMEYGSARWGTPKDIEPFMAPKFADNIILTKTERLKRTLSEKPQDSRPSPPSLKRTRRSCAGRYGRHFPKLAALTNFLPFCCGRV